MRIVPLDAETWPALVELFSAGGDPRWCWCMYWRRRGLDWTNSTAEGNRAELEALSVRRDGPAPGLVALDDEGRAIGWVAVGPRSEFERIERSRVIPRTDELPVWAVVCFVVARRARGHGVGRALLDAAVAHARANGAPAVEAYPADPGEERLSAAAAYTGVRRTFEAAGFRKLADTGSKTGGHPRVVMRLDLGRATRHRATPPDSRPGSSTRGE